MKVVPPAQGKTLSVLGETIQLKLTGDETGGAYSIIEATTPLGGGPPLHMHHREDECLYVLEGEFEFTVGSRKFPATAGTFVYGPRIPHTFRNLGQAAGRMLVWFYPAGFENFFVEIDALPPGPPNMAQVMSLARKYDLEILPPPPG